MPDKINMNFFPGAIRGSQRFQVFTQTTNPIQLNFNCTGAENNLPECLFSRPNVTLEECLDPLRNAYIACQGNYSFLVKLMLH